MLGILKEIEEVKSANDISKSIEAIWYYAQNWLNENEEELEKPQQLTVDMYKNLTESVAVTKEFLEEVQNQYYKCIKLYSDQISDYKYQSESLINLITDKNLTKIKDRVEEYEYNNNPAFIARAIEDEYFITANGKLRKNLIHFDSWYEKDEKTIIDFYKRSIKKIFRGKPGYLVFIDKQLGSVELKNLVERLLQDQDLSGFKKITFKNGKLTDDLDQLEKNEIKEFCVIDDFILNGERIKETINLINTHDNSDFYFKGNVVLNNEQYKSENKFLKNTISYFKNNDFEKLLNEDEIQRKSYHKFKQNNVLEYFMFGVGSAISLGDERVGLKFESVTRKLKLKLLNKLHA